MKRLKLFLKSAWLLTWHRKTLKAHSALAGRPVSLKELTPAAISAVGLNKQKAKMVAKYEQIIGHTDFLLRKSMVYAYERAIEDTIRYLVPPLKAAHVRTIKDAKKNLAPGKPRDR